MNIVRRTNSPLSNLYRPQPMEDQFGRLVENMFEEFFSPYAALTRGDADATVTPRVNVVETDKSFEVDAELPGAQKEDIKVSIDDRRITIEAEAKREERKEGENVIYAERMVSKFSRTFLLPAAVDDAQAQAKFENGVLHLSLPKKDAESAKKITVQ
jgi:HSP20 family protein